MKNTLWLAILTQLFAPASVAQWVPLSAKMRETVEIHKAGKVETRTRVGTYYRSSDGSTLEQWAASADEPENIRVEYLIDAKTKATYDMYRSSNVAVERSRQDDAPAGPARPLQLPKRGEARDGEASGLPCLVIPSFDKAGPDKPLVRSGESCWSNELSLSLRRENTRNDPRGNKIHVVFEYYDVVPYVEPDAKLFDPRARGYRIHRAEPGP